MLLSFLAVQLISSIVLFIPVYLYFNSRKTTSILEEVKAESLSKTPTSIILPMRDESSNAERIINEVIGEISEHENCEILVIDSNSSDETSEITKQTLDKSALDRKRWKIITAEKPGKSHAVNLALRICKSEIIIMIDADVTVEPGWLKKFQISLATKNVGVASGIEIRNENQGNSTRQYYRSYSNKLRSLESSHDTTPVLEGGLISWRKSALEDFLLDEGVNADDAQITFRAIRNGYRTIVNPKIVFYDKGNSKNQTLRSVRRSQGLSRVLLRNRDLCKNAPRLRARRAIFHALTLYVFFPWALFLFLVNPLVLAWSQNYVPFGLQYVSISMLSFLILTNLGRSVLWGASISLVSHSLFLLGVSFSTWTPSRNRIPQQD